MTTLKGVSTDDKSTGVSGSQSDDPNEEGWATHPEVAALVELLGEASTWITQVMEEKAPHRARSIVVTALHEECCAHSVRIIQRFCQGEGVVEFLNVAQNSQEGKVETGSNEQDDGQTQKAHEWTNFDEVLDQYSFVLQVAERYLRLVTVSLSLGTMAEGSKLRCPLTKRCQEMISDYVTMEQTFISNRIKTVLQMSTEMKTETGFAAASWPDDLFFVVYKSICRSASTHNVMACAACSNNAVQHLAEYADQIIVANTSYCDTSSSSTPQLDILKKIFSSEESGDAEKKSKGEYDDIESDLHAALSSLLLQQEGSSTTSSSAPSQSHSGSSQTKEEKSSRKTTLPLKSLSCLNSMAMAKEFSGDLVSKFRDEVNRVFPQTSAETESQNSVRPEFEYCQSELHELAKKFRAGLNSCADNFINSVFVPRIYRLREIITVEDYQTEDVSILERDQSALVDGLLALIKESKASLITRYLVEEATSAVWHSFCGLVSQEIENSILENTFSEVGALRLHQEVDQMNEILKSMINSPKIDQNMQRVLQLTKALSVERVTDLYTLYFPKYYISVTDIGTLVNQRRDLNSSDIEWEKIPVPKS